MRLGVYPDFSKFAAKYLSVQVGLNGFIISKPVIGQFYDPVLFLLELV